MTGLSNSEILSLWEKGHRLHPLDQGLLALSALAVAGAENAADWPVGRRNRRLFEMHCHCFGSRLQGWTACPGCGEHVEFELDAQSLMHNDSAEPQDTVAVGDCCFRLPTSRDLAKFVGAHDDQSGAVQLAQLCLVTGPQRPEWSDEELEEIGEKITMADPMAETRLSLRCPECGDKWEASLNIARFVWAEVESRARRLLWEVHMLASSYGWSERETISLSAERRAIYMEMVQA